jgi:hypothetical protein
MRRFSKRFSQVSAEAFPPPLCEYNEQAATVRTPAREKKIDAPDPIRIACVPRSACSKSQCCRYGALGVVFWMLISETVVWDMLTRASTTTSLPSAELVMIQQERVEIKGPACARQLPNF